MGPTLNVDMLCNYLVARSHIEEFVSIASMQRTGDRRTGNDV